MVLVGVSFPSFDLFTDRFDFKKIIEKLALSSKGFH